MRVIVTMALDLDCDKLDEIGGRPELRHHIETQVKITGHLYPEHPMFRAVEKATVKRISIPRKPGRPRKRPTVL